MRHPPTLWYRHWLELRSALVPLALMCLTFMTFIPMTPSNALRWDVWLALPVRGVGPELLEMPLGQSIGDQIAVWAAFAGRMPWFGFAMGWVLAGNGVHRLLPIDYPYPMLATYTLTLPVSRTRLVLTRYFLGLGMILVAGLLLTGIGVFVFVLRGDTVPLVPLAESMGLGAIYSATSLALGCALAAAMPHRLVVPGSVHLGIFAATLVPIHYLVASPARAQTPWGLVGGFVAITILCLVIAVRRTKAGEY